MITHTLATFEEKVIESGHFEGEVFRLATCTCGWRAPIWKETIEQARASFDLHKALFDQEVRVGG